MSEVLLKTIVGSEYAVPEGVNPRDLLPVLLAGLSSPDPVVRDEQAYTILAVWLEEGHLDSELTTLGETCAKNFGGGPVLLRSFSALIMAECLSRGRQANLLDKATAQSWMTRWEAWYPNETDVRSFEDGTGWIHAVAHGADVAAEWGRWPLSGAERLHLCGVLEARLHSLPEYLNQGEDDRLAMAFLSVFSDVTFGPDELEAWSASYRTLWTQMQTGKIPPGAVLAVRTLHSLHSLLHLGATINGAYLQAVYQAEAISAVQDALKSVCPFYGRAEVEQDER